MGKEVLGAAELDLIREALAERFGSEYSPASIARVLADHGARLGHPEILQADTRWRERRQVFTTDDLTFDRIESAIVFTEKLGQAEDPQSMRASILLIKSELDVLATLPNVPANRRAVARETAQWLTVWLQNPQIFPEWLSLRRSTTEFQELFGTFPPA